MPAIKVKGSAAAAAVGFSPLVLPASLLVGGGGEEVSVEEGVSWEVGGGGILLSAAGGLGPNVGGMGSDLAVGLVLVKLMPDGSLENPDPVFLKPPELERFTPGGSLKLEFLGAAFGSLSLFACLGGSSRLPLLGSFSFSDFASGFVSASAFSFFSSAGFSGF